MQVLRGEKMVAKKIEALTCSNCISQDQEQKLITNTDNFRFSFPKNEPASGKKILRQCSTLTSPTQKETMFLILVLHGQDCS